MAQHSVLALKGLTSAGNPYSNAPQGGLVKATNAVFRGRGVLEPRRGQKYWDAVTGTDTTLGAAGVRSNVGHHWLSAGTVVHSDTTTLARVVAGVGRTDYSGSYTPVDAATLRMRFVEAALNLYFNTNGGMYLLEAIAGTPALAGVAAAWDDRNRGVNTSNLLADANGWMANDTAVAYRYVYGLKDSNGNVKLGAPSGRHVIRNRYDVASGSVARAANVVTVTLTEDHNFAGGESITLLNPTGTFGAGPHTITGVGAKTFTYTEVAANATSATVLKYATPSNTKPFPRLSPSFPGSGFLRIYRSEETASADTAPSDDMYLVTEFVPSASDLSNGYTFFTDRTPSSQLGPPAYWNPNDGDGLAASKYPPPIGKDMLLFDGRLWCFNTTDKHRFHLRLLGIGTPDGVQNNDTITIGGVALTAKTGSASAASFQFLITTSQTIGQNIERTAQSLVEAINKNYSSFSPQLVAYYASGADDAPGEILIEERFIGGAAFSVYASRIASWGPALTTGSSGAQTSTNDNRPHGACYSDVDEPEAFPLTQWLPVAPKGVNILKAVVHRDKVYCFAENRKAYTITGPAPYYVRELDAGALVVAPDTVVVHAGRVHALTDKGFGVLTDAGFQAVSDDLNDDLLDVMGLTPATLKRRAFAFSYESESQCHLWVPTASADTCAKRGYIVDSLDGQWTTQAGSRTWGLVRDADGKLYMGDGATNKLRVERKSLDRTDFADEGIPNANALGLFVFSSTSITLVASDVLLTGVAVGDILYQPSTGAYGLVTAANASNNFTVVPSGAFATQEAVAAYYVLKAYPVTLKFVPAAPGGPCVMKQFIDVTFHLREFNAYKLQATFDTETYVTEATATLTPFASYSVAPPAAEAELFAAPPVNRNRRVEVTANHHSAAQLRVGLTITEAWARWALQGFTLNYDFAGDGGRP